MLSFALAILGVGAATLLVAWFGFGKVAQAILSVGGVGFALYGASQAALFVLMGVAWWVVAPSARPGFMVFAWGRAVRDSAGACLPFSQVGGFVLGARAVTLHGVAPPAAIISTVVDLTNEFVAEILFLVVGLVILLAHSESLQSGPTAIGAGAMLIAGAIAFKMQRRAAPLLARFGCRMLGRFSISDVGPTPSEAELTAMYDNTSRIALGTLLHLVGWFGKGASGWIGYRLLGSSIDLGGALAIEALLHAVLALAVLVPGNVGIQEAGYAGLGTLFGITPEISLSASLLRRARDLALGIPILLVWQFVEVRRIRRGAAGA
jgi:putative membrane protein